MVSDCCGLCGSLSDFVFQVVVLKLQSDVQKKNLSSFNLGLLWFGYREVFSCMRSVLWH